MKIVTVTNKRTKQARKGCLLELIHGFGQSASVKKLSLVAAETKFQALENRAGKGYR